MIIKKPEAINSDTAGDGAGKTVRKRQAAGILGAFLANQVSLRGFISRFMVSTDEIDDVSQEAFLRAYKAEQKTPIDQPKAYLFRVAKNILHNEFTNKTRKVTDYVDDIDTLEFQAETETLEDNIIAQQRLGIYCEAIASLPEQCRRVMLMKKVYGLSTKEVARRLGISTSTVEKHMTKGLKDTHAVLAERYRDVDKGTSTSLAKVDALAPSSGGRTQP